MRKGGDKSVEITEKELFDIPRPSELTDVPVASDSQPVFVLWKPDTRLDYLQFFSVDRQEELKFNSAPKEDGIIEIRPTAPLETGYYCYAQGDPMGMFLPGWCFKVQ